MIEGCATAHQSAHRQTIAGDVLACLRAGWLDAGDEALKLVAEKMMIPRQWVR